MYGSLRDLFHICWVEVVCIFWEISPFCLSCLIYMCRVVPSLLLIVRRSCFFLNIGNWCLFSFCVLSVLLRGVIVYWSFERTSSLSYWFFSIVFSIFILIVSALNYFHLSAAFWFILLVFFRLLRLELIFIDLKVFHFSNDPFSTIHFSHDCFSIFPHTLWCILFVF